MNGCTVLVVDDDSLVRRLVRTVLEADGYEVEEAANGPDGLEAASRSHPDLMVLDVMMPGMDGIEVCRRLDRHGTKVLMLTASDDVATEEAGRAAGADHFLVKPFSPVALLESVEKLVGGP